MLSALLRAFAGCAGARAIAGDRGGTDIHNAFGLRPDGTPWVSAAQCGGEVGPFGATRHGDGETQMFSYQANGVATAVEAIEADVPVVMLRHEPLPDSAGPGRHRGGAAMVRDTLWTAPTEHHLMSLRAKRAAGFGVQGGHDGRPGGVWVFDPPDAGWRAHRAPSPRPTARPRRWPGSSIPRPRSSIPTATYVYPFPPAGHTTPPGAILRYVNAGGGGWGDPLQRDPEAVKRDVRDGYVSLEGAARDYGVVIAGDPDEDPEGLTLDLAATERLRADRGA